MMTLLPGLDLSYLLPDILSSSCLVSSGELMAGVQKVIPQSGFALHYCTYNVIFYKLWTVVLPKHFQDHCAMPHRQVIETRYALFE